ncbi:MAG: HD domain-containing protein [Lachnospiraceae bacterium]|nr:HD domain-containing protein [Lachnospiraceae bacterium]
MFTWHKHYDVNLTLIFAFIPVVNLGYLLEGLATDTFAYLNALKITYIGGCFLTLFILFCILNLCKFKTPRWVKLVLFLTSSTLFIGTLTSGYYPLFYKEFNFEMIDGVQNITKTYGPLHNIFYVLIISYLALGLVIILYSRFKMRQVPRTVLNLLIIPNLICVISYFVVKLIKSPLELIPLGYVLAQIAYLAVSDRASLYNVADTVVDSMVKEDTIGYMSFDLKLRFLGCNSIAARLFPHLNEIAVDDTLSDIPSEKKIFHFLVSFQEDNSNHSFLHAENLDDNDPDNDRFYNVNVNYLYDGSHKKGYIITFTDDTENKKYIRLIDSYNEKLQSEVEAKTKHIVEMHDNLIMSMAVLVESRDNSTGGHIKRTSEGVRILIDELVKEGRYDLSDEFCRDMIKAAPMHDLGKIAVDDAVLRKPGKFEPEEYEKMKKHSEEGARAIHEILLNTDDESFKKLAENVAHYHHERWDGSGYPEGLKAEEIPFEARIMAIADVYDALVSKRVYKDSFSFEKADSIIMEGMGSQFDPGLKSAYTNARPRLEEYYSNL